jgi:lipoprotein-releasing system permease protein
MLNLPYEIMLGLRYTRAKRRNGFISFISFSSLVGIALGITALITVMSIMNGFQEELRDRILGMTAHMTVNEEHNRLSDWNSLYNQLINQPHIEGAAPNIMEQGMVSMGAKASGVAIRGVLPEFEGQVADIESKIVNGSFSALAPKKYRVLIGSSLALSLGVTVGDKVNLIAPKPNFSPIGATPRIKRFTVAGIFETGALDYDSAMVIVHIRDAQKLFKYGDEVSALQLKLDDMFSVGAVKNQLAYVVDKNLYILDWRQQHINVFKAIEIEKRMMFVVLTLIVLVAVFNIVSTMVMVVTDKNSDIAVLRTIGATPMAIQMIFITQGMVIGLFGVILGLTGGLSLALNMDVIVPFIENLFGFQFFPPDTYMLSKVPSKVIWSDVWYITGIAFVLTLLATLYPARRASKIHPAEALRYE